ncbi:MAG: hypothetical protein NTZ46_03305 [Verrucomicrobia bacterium]|nr:hypothetical protein [Verrucomicrobiota bacterium]
MKYSAFFVFVVLAASGLACNAQTAAELGISPPSDFDAVAMQRDPFLPLGWHPPDSATPVVKGAAAVATTESYIRPEAFVVSSISVDRLPLAVINGKTYGEGDPLPFMAGERKIVLKVYAIRDGAVTLIYNDFKVTCPIRLWQKPAVPGKKP